jgi:chemotaxis protein MotA
MDLATLVGVVMAWALVVITILIGGPLGPFINPPSLVIVVGGTIATVMVQFNLSQFLATGKVLGKAFSNKNPNVNDIIEILIDMADVVRKEGLLGLETKTESIEDNFLTGGIQLCVDGHDISVVQDILGKEMKQTVERHKVGNALFSAMGAMAPALGMIGTLIGLVQMLSNMEDPASIGPAMAVALLTTLYGAVIANCFAIPIAGKLALRADEEKIIKTLIIAGISGILDGQNPRVLREALNKYLPASDRIEAD